MAAVLFTFPDSSAMPVLGLIVLQLVLGLVAGRWWALLLPVPTLPVIAALLERPTDPSSDFQTPLQFFEFTLALIVPVAVLLVALGVAARKLTTRLRTS